MSLSVYLACHRDTFTIKGHGLHMVCICGFVVDMHVQWIVWGQQAVVKHAVGTQRQQQRDDDLSHNHNPKMELKQSGLTAVYKTKHVLVWLDSDCWIVGKTRPLTVVSSICPVDLWHLSPPSASSLLHLHLLPSSRRTVRDTHVLHAFRRFVALPLFHLLTSLLC